MTEYEVSRIILKAGLRKYKYLALPLIVIMYLFYVTITAPPVEISDNSSQYFSHRPADISEEDATISVPITTPPDTYRVRAANRIRIRITIGCLLLYFLLLYAFRFKKYFPIPAKTKVTSPINGKVIDLNKITEGTILTIQKPFFASSELVSTTRSDFPFGVDTSLSRVSWEVSGGFGGLLIDDPIPHQGALVGTVAGKATCEIFIPVNYIPVVFINSKVVAGETVIAKEMDDYWTESDH